jgi:hypothetical protein
MARYEHLPIYKKAFDLTLEASDVGWVERTTWICMYKGLTTLLTLEDTI